jgi:hypothetical protein
MSFRNATKPQDLEPERLKPAPGAPTLGASVEAEGLAPDLCIGQAPNVFARERILAWLAEGVREVTWALCSLQRERWAVSPPTGLGDWPALRHVQHLALREAHQVLPAVRQALGDSPADAHALSTLDLERADAAWDPAEPADAGVRRLGDTRFDVLQRLESAPDAVWDEPRHELTWLLLNARQHELQHLSAIWKLALNWDRVPGNDATRPSVPLHPADRLEESH